MNKIDRKKMFHRQGIPRCAQNDSWLAEGAHEARPYIDGAAASRPGGLAIPTARPAFDAGARLVRASSGFRFPIRSP